MIATTLEQSRKLVELGADVGTADMCYQRVDHENEEPTFCLSSARPKTGDIPAWSLSALLKLMPYSIGLDYWFSISKSVHYWKISYEHFTEKEPELKLFKSDKPLEGAFKMVCWLLVNKYI